MTSSSCARPGCRRVTRDSSGRCHDHRGSATGVVAGTLPAPRPSTPSESTVAIETNRRETWRDADGKPHRIDGPALVNRDREGRVNREFYAVHGKTHRYEGPAVTTFYDDGTKGSESYHRHGSGPHRFDGPAMIEYREDGTLIYARFQFDGKGYDGPPVLHGALEGLEDDWLRDELRGTIYGELATDGSDLSAVAAALGAGVRTVEGIREVLDGAPIEWVRAYEEGRR